MNDASLSDNAGSIAFDVIVCAGADSGFYTHVFDWTDGLAHGWEAYGGYGTLVAGHGWECIYISAGMRGMQILIAPLDLQKITEAEFVDLL